MLIDLFRSIRLGRADPYQMSTELILSDLGMPPYKSISGSATHDLSDRRQVFEHPQGVGKSFEVVFPVPSSQGFGSSIQHQASNAHNLGNSVYTTFDVRKQPIAVI